MSFHFDSWGFREYHLCFVICHKVQLRRGSWVTLILAAEKLEALPLAAYFGGMMHFVEVFEIFVDNNCVWDFTLYFTSPAYFEGGF